MPRSHCLVASFPSSSLGTPSSKLCFAAASPPLSRGQRRATSALRRLRTIVRHAQGSGSGASRVCVPKLELGNEFNASFPLPRSHCLVPTASFPLPRSHCLVPTASFPSSSLGTPSSKLCFAAAPPLSRGQRRATSALRQLRTILRHAQGSGSGASRVCVPKLELGNEFNSPATIHRPLFVGNAAFAGAFDVLDVFVKRSTRCLQRWSLPDGSAGIEFRF